MSSFGTESVTTTAICHGRVTAQCDTDRWEAEVSSFGTESVITTAIRHGRVTAQCDTDRWEAEVSSFGTVSPWEGDSPV